LYQFIKYAERSIYSGSTAHAAKRPASLVCRGIISICLASICQVTFTGNAYGSVMLEDQSVARCWNEALLEAIRLDFPAPTIHARNLFHSSIAMWDAWAAYDPVAVGYVYTDKHSSNEVEGARQVAISYAAFRVLTGRYALAVDPIESQAIFDALMDQLGLDPNTNEIDGESPAAIGNRIGAAVLGYGLYDFANETNGYADDTNYTPVNEPMIVKLPGADMEDPNRWQPLALDFLILQNGIIIGESIQEFVGPNWGKVKGFALSPTPDGSLQLDPGPPPQLGGADDARFKSEALEAIRFSSLLDPTMPEHGGKLIDIGPASNHNNSLGTRDGQGYPEGNPVTGEPYASVMVKQADYGRVLAEFWADGPESETPPGHWNVVANKVADHPLFERRMLGIGEIIDPLEWDVKLYFALNSAVHDAAVVAWGAKAFYDFSRPISMIRYMGGLGQSSDSDGPSYHPDGLTLEPGLVELITETSSVPGERHEHLAGQIGDIAILAWLGNPPDPETGTGGVGWMPPEAWVPYQKATFVTPAFAAYVSGHSTFSRAAAEVLARMTGTPYFPGGLGTFLFTQNGFLVFERGPTEDVTLEWATYFDAADEAGTSRLYGGIHVAADDFEGRKIGSAIGQEALAAALPYFDGTASARSWRLTYPEWRSLRLGSDVPGNQPGDRPEGGLSNLETFAFGLPAGNSNTTGMPVLSYSANAGSVTMRYTRPAEGVGVTYSLERSRELKFWESVPVSEQQVHQTIGEKGLIDVAIEVASDPKDSQTPWFYRVIVTDGF
jgi:hypothetical protein